MASIGLSLILSLPAAAWADSIPAIAVDTLAGSAFVLPRDLAAATDILVIGFTQKAGSNTRPWSERLQQDFTPARGFAVYPVAVLAGVPLLFRSFALGSVKNGVALTERSRFLVADHDERTWRRVAGDRLPDDPYIVVLDRSGSVLLREAGLFDEQSYEKIAARIRAATRKGS